MDKSYPAKTPMVVRSLDIEKDPFRPREEEEKILGPHVPYISAIVALMYLANSTYQTSLGRSQNGIEISQWH